MPRTHFDDDDDTLDDDPDAPLDSDLDTESDADTRACPHCRREIYEEAEQCPHCGAYVPLDVSSAAGRSWLFIATAIVVALICAWWAIG